ncbi:Saccharopine dehydrogenase-like oxidoreductase [Diplogelasinospora grovesii]|uniref:Saccharopine dehydrogenase-like oxidoreductase n=1 Tax=Diplogelasinospora grovesii TaxID=303347 RepID=A0AAN6S237_9PEZI|nr:Saccharopine dehydrogenase-like oxidoreductase [Diplogelasinospora grovesii]
MVFKQHGRQYDLVVFGATGYTGKFTAQHITTHLPTDLKWAVAGRSRDKLEQVVAQCKALNPDRRAPEIEICNLDDTDLASLAKKTFILITTVGPYGKLGEHAFKACAENGTHYLDVTGEVPFVARMIKKYEAAAKASGALMFPQIGIESAPSDLVTWSMASLIRSQLGAKIRDVTVSIHTLKSAPSGGTLNTALTIVENFTYDELRTAYKPFGLSPVPKPKSDSSTRPSWSSSLLSKVTGLATHPTLGLQTTSIAGRTDAAIVGRTWGLLSVMPGAKQENQSYGPNFSFRQYMKTRNWLGGIGIHYGIMLLGLILVTSPLRWLAKRSVYQPGEGQDVEEAKKNELEYRAVAQPDVDDAQQQAYCRAWYHGPAYYLTGLLLSEAAVTILEQHDLEKNLGGGGIYTPACLGQPFIDRLDKAGFHFETKMMSL